MQRPMNVEHLRSSNVMDGNSTRIRIVTQVAHDQTTIDAKADVIATSENE
jgi:hypothetical protein